MSDFMKTVEGIRSAGMTQCPALLAEALEACMKAGCFKDSEALKRFVAMRVSSIEAWLEKYGER